MRKLLIFLLMCSPVMGQYTQKDSNTGTAAGSGNIFIVNTSLYVAAKITAGSSYTLTKAALYLSKTGSPTSNIVMEVYSDNSGAPSSSLGTSTNTISASTLTGDETAYEWTFDGVSLASGSTYYLVIHYSTPGYNIDNYCSIFYASYVATGTVQKSGDATSWTNLINYRAKYITYESSATTTTTSTSTSTTTSTAEATTTTTGATTTSTTSTSSSSTTSSTAAGATTTLRKSRMLTMGVG